MLGKKEEAYQHFSELIAADLQSKKYSLISPTHTFERWAATPREINGYHIAEVRAYNLNAKRAELVRYIANENYKTGKIELWKCIYRPNNSRQQLTYESAYTCEELESLTTYKGIICTEQERAAYKLKHERRQAARELYQKPIISKARALEFLHTKKGCKTITAEQLQNVTKNKAFRHKGERREGLSYVFTLDKPKNYRVAAYYGCLNPSSLSHYWEKSHFGTVCVSGLTVEDM